MPFLEIYKGAVHINSLLDNRIKEQLDPNSDVNREIGAVDTIDGKEVYWSGQNYGWQSKASYEKLKKGDEFKLGHIAASRLEASAGKYIGQAIDQLPESVKEKGAELIQGAVDTYESLPKPVQYIAEGTVSNLGKINQAVSDVTNVSPILTAEALTLGAGAAVKPVAKTAKIVTKKGAVSLAMDMPAPTAYALTATDPRFIAKGVTQGVGQSELYKAGVQKLRKLQADGIVKRKLYQEQFDTGVINEKQLKSRLQKLKKREDANYSTLGTVEDPDIFEVPSQVQRDPIDPALPAHQHHAAGKAMTSPWVQQVLKLGDDDDVVAFFELHRMLTGSGMGNVKSGIIDMPGFAHIPRDARTPADVPMAVHSFMKKSGADIEILTSRVEKIIGNPKNMDELMEKYATFAVEYLIPQKELSLKRLNQVLTEHRRTLPPEQIKTFDDLVSKLNKANT